MDVACDVVARVGIVVGYEVWDFPSNLSILVAYELKKINWNSMGK